MARKHIGWVVAAVMCACTQDFDIFLQPTDAGGDATSNDSSAADVVTDAGVACDVAPTCLTNANACGQSCISGYGTCVSGCGGTNQCKGICKSQQQTCDMTCTANCIECVDAGCGPTACQAAIPQ